MNGNIIKEQTVFVKASKKTAFVWQDAGISYEKLLRHICFYETLFNGREAQKVAIFSGNRPEWAYVFLAAWKKDAIPVPIDFMAPAEEVAYILNDCRPEVVFCSAETARTMVRVRELLDYGIQVHVFEDQNYDADAFPAEEIDAPDASRTAAIIYTSGTTGSPKGVMLAFDNILANIEAVTGAIPIYSEHRNVMMLLPLHHIFPLLGTLLAPLYVGATIALASAPTSEAMIAILQKNKISIMIGVPRLYVAIRKGVMGQVNKHFLTRSLFKLAEAFDSSIVSKAIFKKVHQKFGGHLKYLVCGGAKMDEDAARDFKTLGFEMLEGFGMTEAGPMITFTRPGHWKIGSAGQPMPDLEVKIKDGEIIARGRNIMQGYYNRPEETRAVLKHGWLYTGDTGHIDDEGFIHVTGRSKDILVLSSGKNINPEEIEKKIGDLSDCVAEVGVFMKNDTLQAAIYPDFIKLREKGVLNIRDLFRWEVIDRYNRSAASYKKVTNFILLKEELPKTRLGKIQRFKLASTAGDLSSEKKRTRPDPQFQEYQVIRNFLKEQTNTDIHPDDHIEMDLALDSLDKVSLQAFLHSTFGINIQEDIFLQHPTVEKLSLFMKAKKSRLTVEAVRWAEIFKEKVDLTLPRNCFTQNLFKNVSRLFFSLYFRMKAEGTENLPEGPFILASNHQSFFDGLFVSIHLRNKVMKNTYFYAKEKHIRGRWLKSIAHRNNVIIMNVNRDLKQSLQKLAEVLKKGKNIMIFPEGTRTRTGSIGHFKKTFAILSRELNVPVVPVSIKGAFEALPRGSFIPRPWKKIKVKFHKPIFPEGRSYEALRELVHQTLSADLAGTVKE